MNFPKISMIFPSTSEVGPQGKTVFPLGQAPGTAGKMTGQRCPKARESSAETRNRCVESWEAGPQGLRTKSQPEALSAGTLAGAPISGLS